MRRNLITFLSAAAFTVLSAFDVAAQWNDVGTANFNGGDCVQLTSSFFQFQTGAAWHDCQINLDADFDLEFTVNLGNDDGGADGMCFVLHQEGNTMQKARSLGYRSRQNPNSKIQIVFFFLFYAFYI